jgi:hypothetical protein
MKPFEQSMTWYASDDINIPHPSGFVMRDSITGLVANRVVATGLFPDTITFEAGDVICAESDWAVAKIIRRLNDDELELDRDIFVTPGGKFRIYRQNKGTPGSVYNVGGSAKDFRVLQYGFVDSGLSELFTVAANEVLPMKVIRVMDLDTTLKRFTLLF